jgi:hypothetical protein
MLPQVSDLCAAMRSEMATYGFEFDYKTIPLAPEEKGYVCDALAA